VKSFEAGLLKYVHDKYPEIAEGISSSKALSKESEASLEKAVKEYAEIFKNQGPKGLTQYDTGKGTAEEVVKAGVQG
jgi:hypothetical protein